MSFSIKRMLISLLLLFAGVMTASAQEEELFRLINRGQYYFQKHDIRSAKKCYEKALELNVPIGEQEIIDVLRQQVQMYNYMILSDSLRTLAFECSKRGEFEQSNMYHEQEILVLDSMGMHSLIPKVHYFMAHNDVNIGIRLIQSEHYREAKPHMLQALQRDTIGSESYYMAHNWLGHLCEIEAQELIMDNKHAIELYEEGEHHFKNAKRMSKVMEMRLCRADRLVKLNRTKQAEKLYILVAEECNWTDSLQVYRGKAFNGLGELEINIGNFNDAIKHLEEAYTLFDMEGCKSASGAFSVANKLYNLFFFNIGDTTAAAIWKERANSKKDESSSYIAEINAETNGNHRFQMSNSRKYLKYKEAMINAQREINFGNIDKGVAEMTSLANRLEQESDIPLTILANCYIFRGSAMAKKKEYMAAANDAKQAISALNRAGTQGEEDKGFAWYLLANSLSHCGMKTDAIAVADSCIETTQVYYGADHIETMAAYSLRGNIAAELGKKELATNDMLQCFDIVRHNVERNFVYLTERERSSYWDKYDGYLRQMPVFAHGLKDYESPFTDSIYSEQLLAKGLLLTTESALRQAVESDSALKKSYEQIRLLRKRAIDDSTPKDEANNATEEANRLERELGTHANRLHMFLNFLRIGMSDVKKTLPTHAAAIEFVDYTGKGDSTMLGALVLLPKQKHVRFIPLLTDEQVGKNANDTSLYNSAVLSRLIWGQLSGTLAGVKTVYFAPAGRLYTIGIEYLPDYQDSTRRIYDRWQLHRLSSTRELAMNKEKNTSTSSAVYGGLKYDADKKTLERDSKKYPHRNIGLYDIADSLNMRAGAENLPGTMTEARNIDSTLKQSHYNNILLTDTLGTEASFKALSGQRKTLIHIATHGFYWTPTEAERHHHIKAITIKANETMEDRALSRSGLLFSGANNALRGGTTSKGVDDGILTAKEIAELDLRGLDLVALSACQTGLGEISSEGVFGLQRGFKKAGARSILMSLWKVDDRATQMLMTQFYRNWTSGMPKQQALARAQDYLRNYTEERIVVDNTNEFTNENEQTRHTEIWNPFNSPRYWAAFILLDAPN